MEPTLEKTYYIHDNSDRSFMVKITPETILVYKIDIDRTITELSFSYYNYKRVFIGKNTEYVDDWKKSKLKHPTKRWYYKTKGNTILIQLDDFTYVYIGGKYIYSFCTDIADEIIDYKSPIGNSDVPYPYAIGKNNIYLMTEFKFINKFKNIDSEDPYDNYYKITRKLTLEKYISEQHKLKDKGKPYNNLLIDNDDDDFSINKDPNGNILYDKYYYHIIQKYNIEPINDIYIKKYQDYNDIIPNYIYLNQ